MSLLILRLGSCNLLWGGEQEGVQEKKVETTGRWTERKSDRLVDKRVIAEVCKGH